MALSRRMFVLIVMVTLLMSTFGVAGAGVLIKGTMPSMVRLVGASNGLPDAAAGQFTVVCRDLANSPVGGCSVVFDLSGCPDLVLCADQMDPGALTNCAAKFVRKIADAQGSVTFTLLGGSTGAGRAETLANGARVFANGLQIGAPSVAAFDLDGSGGVGASDLTVWLSDFGSGIPYGRSDFDGSGAVDAGDLSEWLSVFGAGGSTQSCAASCP